MAWWRRARSASIDDRPADPSMPLIRLDRIGKVFRSDDPGVDETHALRDVSLEIGPGEYVSISGPSGCGKSTLLRAVAGLARVADLRGEPAEGARLARVVLAHPASPWEDALDRVVADVTAGTAE